MRKTIIWGVVGCAVGLMMACNNNQTVKGGEDKATQEKDIVYNEKIQNTFYGVTFGSSRDEVVTGFAKQGFYENHNSTNDRLSFEKKEGGRHGIAMNAFSFGGMNWTQLHVYLSNNQFYAIEFTSAYKTKESAMESFDKVLSTVSAKYHMFESPIDDTTSYKIYIGKTNNNQWVEIHCYSYESVSHKRWIGVTLAYGDDSFNAVSNEL